MNMQPRDDGKHMLTIELEQALFDFAVLFDVEVSTDDGDRVNRLRRIRDALQHALGNLQDTKGAQPID